MCFHLRSIALHYDYYISSFIWHGYCSDLCMATPLALLLSVAQMSFGSVMAYMFLSYWYDYLVLMTYAIDMATYLWLIWIMLLIWLLMAYINYVIDMATYGLHDLWPIWLMSLIWLVIWLVSLLWLLLAYMTYAIDMATYGIYDLCPWYCYLWLIWLISFVWLLMAYMIYVIRMASYGFYDDSLVLFSWRSVLRDCVWATWLYEPICSYVILTRSLWLISSAAFVTLNCPPKFSNWATEETLRVMHTTSAGLL